MSSVLLKISMQDWTVKTQLVYSDYNINAPILQFTTRIHNKKNRERDKFRHHDERTQNIYNIKAMKRLIMETNIYIDYKNLIYLPLSSLFGYSELNFENPQNNRIPFASNAYKSKNPHNYIYYWYGLKYIERFTRSSMCSIENSNTLLCYLSTQSVPDKPQKK